MATNEELHTFIFNESSKLHTLYEFINNLKEEAVNQINEIMLAADSEFVPYDFNSFFIEVKPTGTEVQTDGYQSTGYAASSSYQIFSLNPDITISATIYINDVNLFTLEINQ